MALRALFSKFVMLLLRSLIRFEAHVSVVADTPTPSFPKGAASLVLSAPPSTTSLATTLSSSPSASQLTFASSSLPSAVATLEELFLLVCDLQSLAVWMTGPLSAYATKQHHADNHHHHFTQYNTAKDSFNENSSESGAGSGSSVVTSVVAMQAKKLQVTKMCVWSRVCQLLSQVCMLNFNFGFSFVLVVLT